MPPFDPPEPTRRGEITRLQPYPDALLDPAAGYELKETVHLAFVAGLQRMPPRQAAVLARIDSFSGSDGGTRMRPSRDDVD